MWPSIFLHEFLDKKIANFQAIPGQPTPASLSLPVTPHTSRGVNSVEIAPGTGFTYRLDEPLREVIGVSCRVRVSYPLPNRGLGHARVFSLLSLGDSIAVLLLPQTQPGLSGTIAIAGLRVDQTNETLGQVTLAADGFTELRFDWHNSGQARLSMDGRLVGYSNAVSPGVALTIDKVVLSEPNAPTGAHDPQYVVARVFVRALRRADSLATFSRLFPVVEVGEDRNRCRVRAFANLLALLDRLRSFMNGFHQLTSQPWTLDNGPPEGPFKPESRQAHNLAIASMLALNTMLRSGDFSQPGDFLDPFTEFLRLLRAAQPTQFDALAAELSGAKIIPEECVEEIERDREKNQQVLGPIVTLLEAAMERINQISRGY